MNWPLYFLGMIIGMVGYGFIDGSFLYEITVCMIFASSGFCIWEAVKGTL